MNKKTIASLLIVDDNSFDILLTRKVLERTGQFEHIYAVTDGAEALALYQNYEQSRRAHPDGFPPLVILLDINMPLMSGFEFLSAYAELETDAPHDPAIIVMLTSSSFEQDRDRALQDPLVRDYIVKPMTRARAVELAETFGR
ncbi:response regulator [Paraliomyxa miuraensis]|uniref:response regulator n=1 Tax=Paraliomyxa miuraensis TaxID=376150 RepID=UPI00224FE603|nr:response regulator [Paraliomyxa miuraensis]MCX4247172.1 response regulator [Paraliomyxa miuraensis]